MSLKILRTEKERIKDFLELSDFDSYMDSLCDFAGLDLKGEAFRKQMELMETDDRYTHREKESLLAKRKRQIVKDLKDEISELLNEMDSSGIYIAGSDESTEIEVIFKYPNDRNGDIDQHIADSKANFIYYDKDRCHAFFDPGCIEDIELILMISQTFRFYDFGNVSNDPGGSYLLQRNRIFQIEYLMWQINCYTEEYRSLRTIKDQRLRDTLRSYHSMMSSKRDEIYEGLIANGVTHARWVSEQKAYIIVKERYPDARFQYQAPWLNGQRLDIYIPSMKTAIEYQGKQHTEAIDFFGGERGLEDNISRDRRKKYALEAKGIKLIYWNYDEPVTPKYFNDVILPLIEGKKHDEEER